jgi:uncharacterized protein (TIGR02001 family)
VGRQGVRFATPALLSALPLLLASASARAEIGFSASVASEERFRGEATSNGRPVATASLSYDDARGPYAGASFTAVAAHHAGIRPLKSILYAGFTRGVKNGIALDVGITHRAYSKYFRGEYAEDVTEIYAGLVGRRVSTHIFYSPDYDGEGGASFYSEVEGLLLNEGKWSLSGHAGLLVPPGKADSSSSAEADFRLSATRRFGRFGITLSGIAATPTHGPSRWRRAVVLSASRSF